MVIFSAVLRVRDAVVSIAKTEIKGPTGRASSWLMWNKNLHSRKNEAVRAFGPLNAALNYKKRTGRLSLNPWLFLMRQDLSPASYLNLHPLSFSSSGLKGEVVLSPFTSPLKWCGALVVLGCGSGGWRQKFVLGWDVEGFVLAKPDDTKRLIAEPLQRNVLADLNAS